jgi:hypothetical protein
LSLAGLRISAADRDSVQVPRGASLVNCVTPDRASVTQGQAAIPAIPVRRHRDYMLESHPASDAVNARKIRGGCTAHARDW